MGVMSGLSLGRAARKAADGARDAQGAAPDLLRGLSEALEHLPVPERSALPAPRPGSGYDRLVDALNRLPRPLMAFGTQALVLYALIDPSGFAARMAGLDAMPEALWWILGAVITAYFGAREAHHMRKTAETVAVAQPAAAVAERRDSAANPALDDWRADG